MFDEGTESKDNCMYPVRFKNQTERIDTMIAIAASNIGETKTTLSAKMRVGVNAPTANVTMSIRHFLTNNRFTIDPPKPASDAIAPICFIIDGTIGFDNKGIQNREVGITVPAKRTNNIPRGFTKDPRPIITTSF
ncbi:MAG: hypothetical protein ACW968_07995 [Candidatus Thorarchaeota archaeon]|jgi:hypothetical protein